MFKYSNFLFLLVSIDETALIKRKDLNEEKVLEVIESSYPNPVSIENIAK